MFVGLLRGQEDSGISSSTEELKEKILQEIKARQDELGVQHETHKILVCLLI